MSFETQPLQVRLEQSLRACLDDPTFYDRFYRIFFERQPSAQESFREVDMALQKQRLAASLPKFLGLTPTAEEPEGEQQNGRGEYYREHRSRHGHLTPQQYRAWAEALGIALKEHRTELRESLSQALDQRLQGSLQALLEAKHAPPAAVETPPDNNSGG